VCGGNSVKLGKLALGDPHRIAANPSEGQTMGKHADHQEENRVEDNGGAHLGIGQPQGN
jgi:hypothetical protein